MACACCHHKLAGTATKGDNSQQEVIMNKWLLYALAGGAVYWLFLRPQKVVPPPTQQQLTVDPNPQQMAPTVQGVGDYYNVDTFPMGSFAN